ncbi:MAG: helix-turn-helix domain-containing protein [bacterium]
MGAAKKYKNYQSENDLPATLRPIDVAEYLGINEPKAYELFNRHDFPSLKIGQRWIVTKKAFLKFLKFESQKQQFANVYDEMNQKEKEIYEKAFWKAISFLKEQEKVEAERQDIIKYMSE